MRLKGRKGNPLPNVSDVYQVDADRLRLQQNRGLWRCTSCRRRTTRRTPFARCHAWRCDGKLEFVEEDPDNYDLQLLDQGYSMLRPEEHTAMVPTDERERLENLFKGESEAINAFVCTPTLELGVDIGQLDAVLMRNVPPLPANYWQRAGRAGRRHRMAVDLTYCRPVSHDRAYFADPLKMLAGRVDAPAFNLRNELMVAKHVHATVITRLHQYTRDANALRGRAHEHRRDTAGRAFRTGSRPISSKTASSAIVRFDLDTLERLITGQRGRPRRLRRERLSSRDGPRPMRRSRARRVGAHVSDMVPTTRRGRGAPRTPPTLGDGADQAAQRRARETGRTRPGGRRLVQTVRRADQTAERHGEAALAARQRATRM